MPFARPKGPSSRTFGFLGFLSWLISLALIGFCIYNIKTDTEILIDIALGIFSLIFLMGGIIFLLEAVYKTTNQNIDSSTIRFRKTH